MPTKKKVEEVVKEEEIEVTPVEVTDVEATELASQLEDALKRIEELEQEVSDVKANIPKVEAKEAPVTLGGSKKSTMKFTKGDKKFNLKGN